MRVKEKHERAAQRIKKKKQKKLSSWHLAPLLQEIEGEKLEVVTDFLFLGSKITVDGDCSHEIKRCLLLGRKAMTNLESVLKSRDITPWTKVRIVKVTLSTVVTCGCELDCKGSGAAELMPLNRGAGEDSW